jgi:serine/threonine protein kinase
MLQPGDILSGYRIESILGRGGMGIVYRAHQLSMQRAVALKVLSAEFLDDEAFRERFRREGRIAAQLDHPNILPVFEADEAERQLFIVTRLVDGPTMGDLIIEQGALRWQRVLEILAPIASALDAAGGAGLVHRDVKPQNILISSGGHPYLADFGLMRTARQSDGMTRGMTRSGEWLGSPDYAAPEHMTDQAYTAAGDIYSLAAVAYHALTGHVAYERMNDLAILHAHASAPPPKISTWNPNVPQSLDAVIAAGMAKDPAARPATASAFIEELAAALRPSSVAAVLVEDNLDGDDESPRRPVLQRRRRHPGTEPVTRASPAAAGGSVRPRSVGADDLPPVPLTVVERPRVHPEVSEDAGTDQSSKLSPVLLFAGSGALIFAVLILAQTILGGSSNPPSRLIQRASYSIELPGGWQVHTTAATSTLNLSQTLTAVMEPALTVNVGRMRKPREGPNPVPAAHAAEWKTQPQADQVRLGGVSALRYDADIKGGLGAERLYVVPTTDGYLAVLCRGPEAALTGLDAQCDRVAATISVHGAQAVTPAPSLATAQGVAAVMARLNRASATDDRDLRTGSATIRVRSARSLAADHLAAAKQLGGVVRGPQDQATLRDLRATLTALGASLTRLANGISDDDAAQYNAARSAVAARQTRLLSVLHRLRSVGYTVQT